jgi:hypothetical protein
MSLNAPSAPTLPDWPEHTVLTLVTAGREPHAIPVSTALRAGPMRLLLGLARTRQSLARLRSDPHVAVAIMAAGDVALTAYGMASVREEEVVEGVAAVEIDVESVQDHNRSTFVIESGVRWRWTDPEAEERDARVRAALARLATS